MAEHVMVARLGDYRQDSLASDLSKFPRPKATMQRYHIVDDAHVCPARRVLQRSILVRAAVILAAIASPATTTAQSGLADTMIVVDAGGQRIPFANISIKGSSAQVTNENGILLFRTNDDTLNVLVRRLGFEAFQGRVGRATHAGAFHITLTRTAQILNKVVVSEAWSAEPLRRNGFYERMMDVKRGAQVGEFFTPEDLQARPLTKISDYLYGSRYAHVEQTTVHYVEKFGIFGPQNGQPRRALLGRAGCAMTLVLDGVVVHNMLEDVRDANNSVQRAYGDDRTTIDDLIPGLAVMAMEVYPSLASALMSMGGRVLGSACGIVAIWTGAR